MAPDAGRPARRALLILALLLLTAGCTTPEIIRETPQPDPTETATLVPVETAIPPTGTPIVETPPRTIERIALATRVDDDGTPLDERSAIPQAAELFYLCVQVRHVEQGTKFQAIWFEGDDILGRSEKLALEDASGPVWMAMQYRPIGELNPARPHAVELAVDGQPIDRYIFRVGVGNPADAIAAAAFTSGFDALGKAISPQTVFPVDSPQLVFQVRISNQVDPAGMLFTTLWFRGDTQIGQRAPDPGGQDPRRLTFTFAPDSPFAAGNYRVALLLNGNEVRSVPFVITTGPIPTPTVEPSQTAQPSVPAAQISDIVVASRIRRSTQEPLGGSLDEFSVPAGEVAGLWVAIEVSDVIDDDTIEVDVLKDDEFYETVSLDTQDLESGWLAGRVELEAPSDSGEYYVYTFQASVNGDEPVETTLRLNAE
ncbi:MAG TPA: hypothetical protein VFV93_16885 [Thermomicrobiales bacterium]|nr:hypothetical protein [Thermomicrobiales bacterium]